MFDVEADAQAWAAPYKGRTVIVRVDPRDPSRSVFERTISNQSEVKRCLAVRGRSSQGAATAMQ